MPHRRHTARLTVALAILLVAQGAERTAARQGPVRAQATVAQDVLSRLLEAPARPVRVLLPGDPAQLRAAAERQGLAAERTLDEYIVVSANAAQVAALRAEPAVRLIAGDVRVTTLMTVSDKAMAADQVRAGSRGALGASYPGVTGRGIGVAVVDSGISPHVALSGKVAAAVSFIPGDASTADAFGHGTHIAGIIAGQASPARGVTALYAGGVAPGAHLVNVRVLGGDGSGYTSSVIAGLDWVIRNRAAYDIRVVNLSLGHSVTGPCVTDPLCSAVARVAGSGIVVVASAGNRGQAPSGQTVAGTITSPGNSPFAITVGALNTKATVDSGDDSVAGYSSRGPAAFDILVKPDLVAPGNKIVSLEARGGFLATRYPELHVAGSGANAYYTMSGASMAAGMVSGGVALLLQGAPALSPLTTKLALQPGARSHGEGLMTEGAGSVNLLAARQLSGNPATLLLSRLLPLGTLEGLAARATGVAWWDGGRLSRRLYAGTGVDVVGVRDLLMALLDPSRLLGDTLYVTRTVLTGPTQILWGEGALAPAGQQILWGEQLLDAHGQQILWGGTDPLGRADSVGRTDPLG